MKKKKVQKKKKKKGEKDDEEIKPMKHENVGNVNFYSEEVAREIINKIISLTFTSIYMKRMNKIIDNFYVRDLLNTIDKLVEMNHINHDMDINIPINDSLKNKSFNEELKKKKIEKKMLAKKIYNKNLNNLNSIKRKEEINIGKTFMEEIDINYLKNKNLLYNIEITNKNFWETIPQPESFSFERTSTYKNAIIIGEEKDIIKEIKSPPKDKNKKFVKLKSFYKFIEKSIEDIYKKKRKHFIKANEELPSERIPNEILGIKEEEEDIKIMRKQLLEEIAKKNLEEKMERERIKMEEIAKKNKETYKKSKKKGDSDDKGINPDSFIQEFVSISSNQKEIKGAKPKSLLEEEKKMQTKKAKNNIEYNYIQKVRTEKEKMIENKLQQKLFIKKYMLKNNKKEEPNSEEESEEPSGNLRPSGSNFDLIKPEIGVIIQENAKVKSGGVNFYEKYNKYSFNDFNKTMNSVFERNFSNNIYFDSNTFTSGKALMNNINSNFNNNTLTTLNNKKRDNNTNKSGDIKKEELSEKNLFRKTFMNRLTNLKKKFIYKSNSEICLSNNINSETFKEALSTKEFEKSYYYYSNYLFDSNKTKNEFNTNFELSYIGKRKNKFINKNCFSPIPTNLLSTYKNTLLKNYFYNVDKSEINREINTSREKEEKFEVIDTFNKNIVDGNDKYNEILFKKVMKSTKNEFLPKIKFNESLFVNKGRTKNSFFRNKRKDKRK